MDIQEIIQMLIGQTQQNPNTLTSLMQHPYSTIHNVTGIENVSQAQASQAVTAMATIAAGNNVDFGNLASIASALLGQNNNSVHTLANSILGSGTSHGVDVSSGISPALMANIAGAMFSGNKVGVNLNDGLDLFDLVGLAGVLLSGK